MNHEVLTVEEAVSELIKATGKHWTANNLLAVLIRFNGTVEATLPNTHAVFSQRYDANNNLVDEQITTSATAKLGVESIPDLLRGEARAHFAKYHNEIQYSPPPIDENDLVAGSQQYIVDVPFLEDNEFIDPVPVTMDMLRVPVKFVEQLKNKKSMWAPELPDVNVEPESVAPPVPLSKEQPEPTPSVEAGQTAFPVPAEVAQAPTHGEKTNLTIYPPLESVTTPTVSTAAAAHYLNRAEQTLRGWAAYENGALIPVRINKRLAWKVADIRALGNGNKK